MIYLMVGIPGAGKTTYAKNVLGHAAYFGTDEIRKELFGKELTLRGRKRVYEMLYRKVNEALQNGCDVVIDCSNITPRRRRKLLDHLPPAQPVHAVYVKATLLRALRNNRKRERHVPVIGIALMYFQLIHPRAEEGFDLVAEVGGD